MPHVALLGDSIFDNAAYTRGEPDVAAHLRALVPSDWVVTLYAVDGSMTADLVRQVARVRDEVTHVVLSLGGNDALSNADLLDAPVRSTAEALDLFGVRIAAFERSYRQALHGVLELGRPTLVCTIYDGNLPPGEAERARVALMMFNDVIVRAAEAHGLRTLELRHVCTQASDYANPIEPSGSGGLKIARAIAAALLENRTARLKA